jgi:putative copper export protein
VNETAWSIGAAATSAVLAIACALAIGALAARRRLALPPAAERRIAWIAAGAGGLAIIAAALRVVLQAVALADPPAAWPSMLAPIAGTGLGRALMLQGTSGVGLVVAEALRGGGRTAHLGDALLVLSAAGLAATPGLGGHAAAQDPPWLHLGVSWLHVAGAGLWLGTLAQLVFVSRELPAEALAGAVRRFHALAITGVALVAASGGLKTWSMAPSLDPVLASGWGRLLLAKLAVVAATATLGYRHWRRAERWLAEGARSRTVASFRAEVALSVLVAVLTGVLVNTSPPGD